MERIIIKCLILITLSNLAVALTLCPSGCSCDDERLLVQCFDGNNLEILPITLNPGTERLIIKYNAIKVIDSSIQFYSELRMLDLSNNQIFLAEDKIFIYQNKLLQLHLNNNRISDINNNTFRGLMRLETLNLRGNYIMDLKSGVFSAVSNIEYLNLGQNRISTIDLEAFSGLKNLKSLYLDDNILTTIPNVAFKSIPYLAELFIGLNSLNSLENDAFRNLINLAALDLHGAMLTNISSASFYRLKNLKSLDLSDNPMTKVPTEALSLLQRLERLKIGQTEFDIIEEGAFFGLSYLRKIDISGCKKLEQIQSGAFAANPNLESITISSNKLLTQINDGVFSNLPNIRNVDLSNNGFKTIREQWLRWESLKSFEVSDNPLTCNCELRWLRELLFKSNKKNNNDILCTSPSQFYEQRLEEVPENMINCSNESSLSAIIVILLIVALLVATITYKSKDYVLEILRKSPRKTQFINNDADCSFEQNHIYEEIHSKNTETMNNIMNHNNAINSNIYSFGCPYPYQVQPQPVHLPARFFGDSALPLYMAYDSNQLA